MASKPFFYLILRRVVLSLILLFLLPILQAQQASKMNFDSIYNITGDSTSVNYYPNLLTKFNSSDSSMSDNEYLLLYYGFTGKDSYNPYAIEEMKLQSFVKKNGYGKTAKLEKQLFKSNHASIVGCYVRAIRLDMEGDTLSSKKWVKNYQGLIFAMISSGNGREKSSATVVNSIADEYQLLKYLKLGIESQVNLGRWDLLNIKMPNPYNIETFYFDKIKIQEGFGK